MAFDGDGFQHGMVAKPRADAVGEQDQPFLFRDILAGKIGLPCFEAGEGKCGKPYQIEAEARIDPVLESGELFMEKEADTVRVAQRPRGPDRDPADRAVYPEKRQLQRPRTFSAPLEIRTERGGKEAYQLLDRFHRADRFGKPALYRERRRRQAWGYRFLHPAERLVDAQEEELAEAPGERRARRLHDRAHRP
jgi:hypothetical protein